VNHHRYDRYVAVRSSTATTATSPLRDVAVKLVVTTSVTATKSRGTLLDPSQVPSAYRTRSVWHGARPRELQRGGR
jgi:hypothetical protein